MSKYEKLIGKIVEYKNAKMGSREIAEKLGGVSKSTVNNYYNIFLESESEDETEDNNTQEEIDVEAILESTTDEDYAKLAKSVRRLQRENNKLRKIQRGMFDAEANVGDLSSVIKDACQTAVKVNVTRNTPTIELDAEHLTVEVLFSDWQIGKTLSSYNSEVAIRRLRYYTEQVLQAIEMKIDQGYIIDKIILGMLGDVIEANKHPDSAEANDCSTAEQLKLAIEHLSVDLVEPIAQLGLPVECIMITGNHDHDGRGLKQFKPGKTQLSYPLYFSVQEIIKAKGYDNVNFVIPQGSFYTTEIYGMGVLYEHGVGVSTSEASMSKRKLQRSEQLRKHLTYFRMG